MTALADAEHRAHSEQPPVPLIVGHRIRCPQCLNLADILDYYVFAKPARFEEQLSTVLKCRAKRSNKVTGKLETCRFVFSVADPLPASQGGER